MLKKIIFIALISASSLLASSVNWAKDYHDAIKSATKENKPVLFISSRHSCKYCVMLDEKTFKDAKVIEALNRDFVSITAYSDENDYMPKDLWRPGTPSIWFLFPDGTPMYQPLPGYIEAANFLNALGIVKEEFDKADAERKAKMGKK